MDASHIENDSFHGFQEESWKKTFLSLMRPAVTTKLVNDSGYGFSRVAPGFVKNNYGIIRDLTLVDPFRLGRLLDLLHSSLQVDGEIVECGSYKGGTGVLMGLYLKSQSINRKIHLFDSFAGLPTPNETRDKGYKRGQFKSDYDELLANIHDNNLDDMITVHKGWFKDTVPGFLSSNADLRISLLHVDCDLYDSTVDCFPDLYPKVVPNGVVVLDDFNDGGRGEKHAVLEHLQNQKQSIHVGPAPQAYIIKDTSSAASCQKAVKDSGFMYCFDDLLVNLEYLEWLKQNVDLNIVEGLAPFMAKD